MNKRKEKKKREGEHMISKTYVYYSLLLFFFFLTFPHTLKRKWRLQQLATQMGWLYNRCPLGQLEARRSP